MSTANIGHFIGGQVVAGTSGRTQDVFNPATGAVTGRVALANRAEVAQAHDALSSRQTTGSTILLP